MEEFPAFTSEQQFLYSLCQNLNDLSQTLSLPSWQVDEHGWHSVASSQPDFGSRIESTSREEEISYDMPYMWNLERNDTDELAKQRDTDLEKKLMAAGEKGQLGSLEWTCTHHYI